MEFQVDDNKLYSRTDKSNNTYNRDIYDWYREGVKVTIFLRTNNKIVETLEGV